MRGAPRRPLGVLWPGLGLLGSVAASAAATRLLGHRPIHWWWTLPGLDGHTAQLDVFWAGIVLLCLAWLELGRRLHRSPEARIRDLLLVGGLWALPLALGPALFSLDMYSYLAQGSLLHHGLNPYTTAPSVLDRWHEGSLVSAVSVNWRHTTAPYGPVFLALAGVISAVAGSHTAIGVTLLRLPELLGLGLLAWSVPRVARHLGADPVRAVWLAVISPLPLLYLVGGGHNDALMAGLLVAGVSLALERRPLAGIAMCALAATIKLPAVAGMGVIGICWLRAEPQRWRTILASGVGVGGGILVLAGVLSGVGLSWISGGLFSTPATVRLAITPATAAAISLWAVEHGGAHHGVAFAAHNLESGAITVAVVLTGLVVLWWCVHVRYETLVRHLGLILLAAAIGGPAAWPWYLCWGLVLLSADPAWQRSRWVPWAVLTAALPVMAGGQVAVSLPDAPRVFVAYTVVALAATVVALRGGGLALASRAHTPGREAPSVPASTEATA